MILMYIGDQTTYEIRNLLIRSDHVLEVEPAEGVTIPAKETGFTVQEVSEPWCSFADFKTIYRIVDGRPWYSDDGSTWIEPVGNINVNIAWHDNDNAEGIRPNAVKVVVSVDGEKLETITLNAKNSWHKEYIDIPVSQVYSVDAKDIDGYIKSISGTTITYTDVDTDKVDESVEDLSKDEQIERLTNLVNELTARVQALES